MRMISGLKTGPCGTPIFLYFTDIFQLINICQYLKCFFKVRIWFGVSCPFRNRSFDCYEGKFWYSFFGLETSKLTLCWNFIRHNLINCLNLLFSRFLLLLLLIWNYEKAFFKVYTKNDYKSKLTNEHLKSLLILVTGIIDPQLQSIPQLQ